MGILDVFRRRGLQQKIGQATVVFLDTAKQQCQTEQAGKMAQDAALFATSVLDTMGVGQGFPYVKSALSKADQAAAVRMISLLAWTYCLQILEILSPRLRSSPYWEPTLEAQRSVLVVATSLLGTDAELRALTERFQEDSNRYYLRLHNYLTGAKDPGECVALQIVALNIIKGIGHTWAAEREG